MMPECSRLPRSAKFPLTVENNGSFMIMKTNRREFLRAGGLGAGAFSLALLGTCAGSAAAAAHYLKGESPMKLGTVTYNLAKSWDIETIIKNCAAAAFQGVELRTTHAHGVEVDMDKQERADVKKRFQDSPVELMGLGSAFDYHTPDQAKLRKDIEGTKEYIILAHDVGAGGVKVRPNGLPPGVPEEKTLEQIGRSLREVGEFGAGYGVQIRLEVHGRETALLPRIRTMLDIADHPMVGVCWNCNPTDLEGQGFDHNFGLVQGELFTVHMRDLYLEQYPFRRLFERLRGVDYRGYCLAEVPESNDPVRLMKYYRALWLAYQDLL